MKIIPQSGSIRISTAIAGAAIMTGLVFVALLLK
jgi:hypothetical protein